MSRIKILNVNDFSLEKIDEVINFNKWTEDNYEYSKKWYLIAKADYKSFNLLIKISNSLAIYHLQQTYEKLAKSLLLLQQNVDKYKLIGHDMPINYLNSFYKDKIVQNTLNIYKLANNLEIDVTKLINLIDKNKIDAVPKNEDINKLLGYLEYIYNKSQDNQFIDSLVKKYKKREKVNFIQSLINKIYNYLVPKNIIKQNVEFENVKLYLEIYYINNAIFMLFLLLYPHYNSTRYPDGNLNYFSYTKDNSIIQNYNRFKKITNQIFIILQKYHFKKERF